MVVREVNPIEKKPLFHFHPGSYAYSISTVGCNLRCAYCQNWQISQWPKDHLPKKLNRSAEDTPEPICPQLETLHAEVPGEPINPADVVRTAKQTGCLSVSYTFTDPTIFCELAYDTAVLARTQGLKNNFISNGFINEAPLREIAPLLDAVNPISSSSASRPTGASAAPSRSGFSMPSASTTRSGCGWRLPPWSSRASTTAARS